MCCGLFVFMVILVGGYIIAMYVLAPLAEGIIFPDLGIPIPILFLGVLGLIIALSAYALVKGGLVYDRQFLRYEERDESIRKRVIRDGPDGIEYVISGEKTMTFSQACKSNWPFQSIDKKSRWFIQDERGNDVSDRTLESSDGVFTIIPAYRSDSPKDESGKEDEYTSIHDSVEYYD